MDRPKLRDSKKLQTPELYPLNEIPREVINEIGKHFVYLLCTGRKDISGGDWGDAFAEAVGGTHLNSPIGIADVVLGNMAWSLKTVKSGNPFEAQNVRLISGRCSPDYSYGITDPHEDLEKTGRAVLGIWNERLNIAQDNYRQIRTIVLIRSNDLLSYCLFEEESSRFRTNEFSWAANSNGNLIGTETLSGKQKFTWQPHGAQFTIHTEVPASAVKFSIKRPPLVTKASILEGIGFDASWVTIHG